MAKTVTWVLIADGAHARVYASEGRGKGLAREPCLDLAAPRIPAQEITSDRPGRAFDSAGQGRHAMESEVDPRRHEELRFTRTVARAIADGANAGMFDRLVLVAPPRTLGDLRDALSKPVRNRVTHEIDKDLVQFGPDEIARHLAELL